MATTPAAPERVRRAYPAPVRDGDDAFVPLAARIGAVAARHAAEHDRDATFVAPAYRAMREHGYLRLPVPAELGGLGASLRQVCYAQAELGRHDGATALAVSMHLHSTLTQAFLHERGAPGAGQVLRRIASSDLVIATSGGSDWLWPDTVATVQDDGSLRVSGRKVFCSQAPEAGAVSTCAVLGRPGPGAEVAHFSVPLPSPGVRLEETWDTLGMRGTASHDLVLDDVRVPAEAIVARRPWGEFGDVLTTAEVHFAPVVAATYLGIAAQARDAALTRARTRAQPRTLTPATTSAATTSAATGTTASATTTTGTGTSPATSTAATSPAATSPAATSPAVAATGAASRAEGGGVSAAEGGAASRAGDGGASQAGSAASQTAAPPHGSRPATVSPTAQRVAGLMDARLRTAWWSLTGALDDLGPGYACTPDTLATVMIAKREAVLAAVEVVGLAMDLAGGGSYFRRSPLERACRDVRAGTFHPLTPEATLLYAGKLAFGDPGVTE
ncbi:hypothetical protein GCM10009850_033200 [Nonomuraea monospora]|uniref:Dibenzothiophene monooxygenase n=1 Tax=Nonomuraea monospora TaxID=568818 RepID=A0ABN3CEX9_9ACTN